MPPAREAAVTVEQLLALGALPAHQTLGGANALLRRVDVVVPGTSTRAIGTLPARTLVVFDRTQLAAEDVAMDLAIRTGYRAQIAGIIAQQPDRPIPEATRRLAEKFELPVVLLDHVEVGAVVAVFEPYVRTPAVVAADLLRAVVTALSSVPRDSGELLHRLVAVLHCPVALVDTDGRILAGDAPALAAPLLRGLKDLAAAPRARAGQTLRGDGGELLIVQAATLSTAASRNLWLIAWPPAATSGYVLDACAQSLAIAAVAFTAYLAERSLEFERENRRRTLLLTEILEQPGTPRRRTVERATALGWRLSGWHTAVHIAVRNPTPGRDSRAGSSPTKGTMSLIEEALQDHRLSAKLVERPTGWAFWTTVDAEPATTDAAELAASVRRALLAVEHDEPHLLLCAGVGGPGHGPVGIGRSLQEAEQACLLARTQDTAAAVEHVAAASVKRLLLAWYSSGPLGDIVTALVEPLRTADPSGELLHTLRVYLDHESAATTTAAVLGVHRNTILNRLDKIQRLLPVDLRRADERLAVHLAVHAAATGGTGAPT